MTATTQRFGIAYPGEEDQAWWNRFRDFAAGIDTVMFELMEAGAWTWTSLPNATLARAGGGVYTLTLSAPATLVSRTLQTTITIPASPALTLYPGWLIVVTIPAGATAAASATWSCVQNAVAVDPDVRVLGYVGATGTITWWNASVHPVGGTRVLFAPSATGGGGATGHTGPTGAVGPRGIRGITGPTGHRGTTGKTGTTGPTGVPGGADLQFQYNNTGAFGGAASVTWDAVAKVVGLGDGTSLALTPGLGTDHTASGEIVTFTVDVNVRGFGAALFVAADGHLEEADADGVATMPVIGLALETGTGAKRVLLRGFIRDDSWGWAVGGGSGALYASTNTGGLTQSAPYGGSDVVQAVGVALSGTVIYFNPSATYAVIPAP